jgi:hypothetical protein
MPHVEPTDAGSTERSGDRLGYHAMREGAAVLKRENPTPGVRAEHSMPSMTAGPVSNVTAGPPPDGPDPRAVTRRSRFT